MIKIRIGYQVAYESPQPTAMVLTLRVHPSRAGDLVTPDPIVTDPAIPVGEYRDSFRQHLQPDRGAGRTADLIGRGDRARQR